ncbi:helix-turn-helix domain-containing protein [Deefgea piscis]|uniref:Helix-turn-helix domain-containing protein n=1 Tax=Deefgea piscis TaxID=2739061 RepID=A0A6M8SZW6_9NEIS|nr:helix-turn-helix domain-containing protein [Deefgea piscis]
MKKNYSIYETASLLGISIRGVHRFATNDPTFPRRLKLGRKTLFNINDLSEWLESKRAN